MNELKELYISGAGGFGREVADKVDSVNRIAPAYRLAGFVDDDTARRGGEVNGVPVLGGRDDLKRRAREREIYAVIAIADTKIKREIARDMAGIVAWANIIHPTAVISARCEMGRGNILQALSSVGANARLGDHCAVNVGSAIGHDAVLGDRVSVMCLCAVNGGARLGDGAYLGSNVMILPGLTLGEEAFICAGSGVFRDVEDRAVMIGSPAERVR
jgi:sugar O-acyltransferase (sialic acid O-acetyltransferase NeuD family)